MGLDSLTPLDVGLAAASGVAIAAACGLRAFLPLLALSLGVRYGLIHVYPGAEWIAGDAALVTLLCATIVELLADKIPAVDHLLDVAALGIRPGAAAIAAWCTFAGAHPAIAVAAAVILGASALGVQVAKAKVRIGSSVITLGTANATLSFLEDAVAVGLSALAVLAPLAALVGVVLVGWAVRRAFRRPAPAH